MDFSFGKNEKLCSKKDIQTLFGKGEKYKSHPFFFRYFLFDNNTQELPKVLIGVSKRRFKRAVDRNRIKRLCREAYRLNKNILTGDIATENIGIHLYIQYSTTEIMTFASVNEAMIEALKKLTDEIKRHIS